MATLTVNLNRWSGMTGERGHALLSRMRVWACVSVCVCTLGDAMECGVCERTCMRLAYMNDDMRCARGNQCCLLFTIISIDMAGQTGLWMTILALVEESFRSGLWGRGREPMQPPLHAYCLSGNFFALYTHLSDIVFPFLPHILRLLCYRPAEIQHIQFRCNCFSGEQVNNIHKCIGV